MAFDKNLDLILERELNISAMNAWKAWTTPELMYEFFCPKPWKVVEAKVDAIPGGIYYTVMQSPEGEKFPGEGCILEAIPGKKLIWTSAMKANYRPVEMTEDDMLFTAELTFEELSSNRCKYTAIMRHANEDGRKKHEEMGFDEGWGIVANQLEALMKDK